MCIESDFTRLQHVALLSSKYDEKDNHETLKIVTCITIVVTVKSKQVFFNPNAVRKAKIVCNFGLSECNRVKAIDSLLSPATVGCLQENFCQ